MTPDYFNLNLQEMANKLRWHLGHLDALRGIAVLGVVLVHSGFGLNTPQPLREIASSGQRGVQLFFIVSAFTLFLSHDNRKDERRPILNFFLRRVFRLFPMFYIAIVLSCIFAREVAGQPIEIFLSLLFLHGLTPRSIVHGAIGGWSVGTEACFYMCLPILFRTVRTLKAAIQLLLISTPLLFLACHLLAVAFPQSAEFLVFLGFPIELPVFALGIVSYYFWRDRNAGPYAASPQDSRQFSFLLLVLTAATYVLNLPFNYPKLYLSSGTCALLVIALSIYPWSFLVNRFTMFLGKISFSLYLLHFYSILGLKTLLSRAAKDHGVLVHSPTLQFTITLVVTLTTTIPLAALAWHFIEEPGIRLGRRVIANLEGRAIRKHDAELVPPFRALTGDGSSPDSQF